MFSSTVGAPALVATGASGLLPVPPDCCARATTGAQRQPAAKMIKEVRPIDPSDSQPRCGKLKLNMTAF